MIGTDVAWDHEPVTVTADEALVASNEPAGRTALYPRQRTSLSLNQVLMIGLRRQLSKTRSGRQALHLQL
jgi:hypothetical protein